MDRQKQRFSAEDALLKISLNSDEEDILEESEDSDEGEIFLEGKYQPSLHLHLVESSVEPWVLNSSQHRENRFKDPESPNSALSRSGQPVSGRGETQPPPVESPDAPEERWNNSADEDITPRPAVFRPYRTPGPQLNPTASYTALQLFQLFLSSSMLQTIVKNTNAYGAKRQKGKWKDISLDDFQSYLLLVIFMGQVKMRSLPDYWRSSAFVVPFPARVMSEEKFVSISAALHLSDPEVDAENDKKRGTAAYDRLCKIKPMYEQLREACKNYFHPFQDVTIDERMVQYMEGKPTEWGYELFGLADSRSGYLWDFCIYEGKCPEALVYESVMALVDQTALGTGYKLFVDNFYTSPVLFRDLLKKNVWACGAIRPDSEGYPKTTSNKLQKKAPRGTHRWLREGDLLFVEWKDKRKVQMCSTIHRGTARSFVQRRVKGHGRRSTTSDVPVPDCVSEYNRCIGGVDAPDTLIGYHTVSHKKKKWYCSFFYRFVDIAIVNAFILHRETACAKKKKPKTQNRFREKLVEELAELVLPDLPQSPPADPPEDAHHFPEFLASDGTEEKQQCRVCEQKTIV